MEKVNEESKLIKMTHAEWLARAKQLFETPDDIRFVCPSCLHEASVKQCRKAGMPAAEIGVVCIGRYLGDVNAKANTLRKAGGPCDYAGYGLIRLNPIEVTFENGSTVHCFDFATPS